MAQKEHLQEKIDIIATKIKTNSKDVHYATRLVDELIDTTQRMCMPTELYVGKRIADYKSTTFKIVKTDLGVLYHEYGGYNIFVSPRMNALYTTLVDFVDNQDEYLKLDGDTKEKMELCQSAMAYCLSLPKIAFTDAEFMYSVATMVVDHIKKQYDKLTNEPLSDETAELNAEFEELTESVKQITDAVNEYTNGDAETETEQHDSTEQQ